jgi:hypothetical protein
LLTQPGVEPRKKIMLLLRRFGSNKVNGLPPKTLIASGLVLICLSIIWPRVTAAHGVMASGGVDFIQGFLLGIGLACGIMGIGSKKKDDSSLVRRP